MPGDRYLSLSSVAQLPARLLVAIPGLLLYVFQAGAEYLQLTNSLD